MPYQSIYRPDLFAGQNIIVTGGGTGIGRCIAHELAALGAHIVLMGRRAEPLETVAAEIQEDGGKALWETVDIRDEQAVTDTVARVVQARGQIHGLVNNAGGQFSLPIEEMNQKGFETVVRTNLVGGFLMSREVFKQSMKAHGGAIVNITADFQRGMPMMSHSGAARAAMDNFTKTAAIEWASHGVRVNAVGPGFIASSGYDTYNDDAFRHTIAKLREWTLLKRDGTEAEVSSAVTFLLSEGAAYITGASIAVDGGAPLISVMMPTPHHDRSKPFNPFHRSVTPAILKG